MITGVKVIIAYAIFESGAIKFGGFKLKLHEKNPKAPLSPIYLNLRVMENDGPLLPSQVNMIGYKMYSLLKQKGVSYDLVAGIPKAGDPFAEAICYDSKTPLLRLNKKVENGVRRIDSIIEGAYNFGQRVLLVDDLITQADTKKEAIAVCEKAGLIVAGLVVIVDREQGGSEELKTEGYNVYSLFTLSELLDFYVSREMIPSLTRDEVLSYIKYNR